MFFKDGNQFTHLIMIRDRRCKRLGAKSQEHLDEARRKGLVMFKRARMR